MNLRDYILVTAGYWAFTLTDGALRMLVLLHFNDLGYSAVQIAFLFLAYEFMGILTNLLGGWVGSRRGLNITLIAGLVTQIVSLAALSFLSDDWPVWFAVTFVMALQALSGVAKDLTKMSSKSAVKAVAGDGGLFRLVAILTGSKNALKGIGFFIGAGLLSWIGFVATLWSMAGALAITVVALLLFLNADIGKAKKKAPLRSILSKSSEINRLSAARFFLFGSRDIWFVVALPVFLANELDWAHEAVGAFLALWVIGYGVVQSSAPRLLTRNGNSTDEVLATRQWGFILGVTATALAVLVAIDVARTWVVVIGLIVFGIVFAMNS
ncbi:MAG: organoarsenical effux MFS transporter ArsJ, partial [Actinomycetota bacterium]|nr:organoarsenical effux MFS transporter ArsJ [Actinomycetota bacterium]